MAGVRRRNSVLASLERIRAGAAPVNLTQVLGFFYICENEGLSVSELAMLLRTTTATASRTVASLGEGDPAERLGLVASAVNENHAQGRRLTLTAEGRRLRDEIDRLIAEAAPIALRDSPAGLRKRSTHK